MTMKPILARAAAIALIPCAFAAAGCGAAKDGYPQDLQDEDTLWAFASLLGDVRHEHIAGTPTGAKDVTASLPGGGSVRITGETQVSFSHLTYTFTDYHAEMQGAGHKAALSRIHGAITATTASTSTSYTSDGLDVSGTLERDGYDPVSLQGPLDLDCTYSSTAATGSVNARTPVSWSSSGSTGTTGGSCDPSYFSQCHQVVNGVSWEGAPWKKECGQCPPGITYQAGEDTVTAGGPYWLCMCT